MTGHGIRDTLGGSESRGRCYCVRQKRHKMSLMREGRVSPQRCYTTCILPISGGRGGFSFHSGEVPGMIFLYPCN